MKPSGVASSGGIGHALEQLLAASLGRDELLLETLQLLLDAFELLQLFRCGLALDLSGRPELLGSRLNLADSLIRCEQLVEDVGRSLARERRPEGVRVAAGCAEVDHERESR